MGDVIVRQAAGEVDLTQARALCREYRDTLTARQTTTPGPMDMFYADPGFSALLDRLAEVHARPKGMLLLAEAKGQTIGCGMSQQIAPGVTEIKRVYVRPEGRRLGAGRALCETLVTQARVDGFGWVRLDTMHVLTEAIALYESLGFQRRGPYQPLPDEALPLIRFYELAL